MVVKPMAGADEAFTAYWQRYDQKETAHDSYSDVVTADLTTSTTAF